MKKQSQNFKMTAEMRVQVRLFKKLLPGYAFFFIVITLIGLLYAIIADSFIGMYFLFAGFVTLRYSYDNQITSHCGTTKKCINTSILLFAIFGIPLIVINLKISLLFTVIVALGFTWLLYFIGCKDEEIKRLKQPKHFDLDNCSEEELRQRCKEKFKRDVEYKTERAIKHFILKLPHNEIDVNPHQSIIERYRFRKILK